MCFFENEFFLNVVRTYKSYTFNMLVPVIVHLADNHWHRILKDSFVALKTILREIDY
jgi:serine/threonine-protein phosphatase 2A regulatory subunit B'